ncbi:MAG TPA: sulfotransferase, partial [Bacteroidetes bacterium]|nr:sulfotransferase [Bacteroidota bacterium]
GGVDPAEMIRLRDRYTKTGSLLWMVPAASLRTPEAGLKRYLAVLQRLYRAVAEVSGARVIIDSSKYPTYGHLLRRLPEIEVFTLHLVRHPEAVAYSWQRRKPQPDVAGRREMARVHPAVSTLFWTVWNLGTEALARQDRVRYRRLRYEDFAASPRGEVENILHFLGESAVTPFTTEHEVLLGRDHMVSGNPNRFATGPVAVRADEEWRERLAPSSRRWVRYIAGPLPARYGYR